MEKILFLIRGIPGAGKSFVAEHLASMCDPKAPVFSADQFFEKKKDDGTTEYKFNAKQLGIAHGTCFGNTEKAMIDGHKNIFVANTFTKKSELVAYNQVAAEHGYNVVHLIVENRHGSTNVHNVPDETMKAMVERFDIKLV